LLVRMRRAREDSTEPLFEYDTARTDDNCDRCFNAVTLLRAAGVTLVLAGFALTRHEQIGFDAPSPG
jgi:hypothetical protein